MLGTWLFAGFVVEEGTFDESTMIRMVRKRSRTGKLCDQGHSVHVKSMAMVVFAPSAADGRLTEPCQMGCVSDACFRHNHVDYTM